MEENKGLIEIENPKSIIKFLQAPAVKIAEALTGILGSDTSVLKLSAGKLVQASIKFRLMTQLGRELKEYIKKGQIKEDYFATHKTQASLCELLKFIDEEVPDEERFKAMKSIFFTSVSKDTLKDDEAMAYELMQICKKITGGGLLVLKAAYDIANGRLAFEYNGKIDLGIHTATTWLHIISKQIGHNISSLVEVYEENLIKLKLISNRHLPDRSGVNPTKHFRLTPLGYKLCEFIVKYQ